MSREACMVVSTQHNWTHAQLSYMFMYYSVAVRVRMGWGGVVGDLETTVSLPVGQSMLCLSLAVLSKAAMVTATLISKMIAWLAHAIWCTHSSVMIFTMSHAYEHHSR